MRVINILKHLKIISRVGSKNKEGVQSAGDLHDTVHRYELGGLVFECRNT